jgi:hypothetical protein
MAQAADEPYRLGIAPVLEYKDTLATYRPLADYLTQVLGREVLLVPSRNFIGYWSQIRKEGTYDFLLDGAHLAAYRMEKMDHQLVAQVDGVLSFTLISRPTAAWRCSPHPIWEGCRSTTSFPTRRVSRRW